MLQGSCHCGALQWCFDGLPESATACNCTLCRRYGVLWAYDYENERIAVSGPSRAYVRGQAIEFHFCPTCGCVAYWRGLETDERGRRRIAVARMKGEGDGLMTEGPLRGIHVPLEDLRRDYYVAMQWNPESGHLRAAHARALGIDGLLAGYLDA
jgi:hypothetical protein